MKRTDARQIKVHLWLYQYVLTAQAAVFFCVVFSAMPAVIAAQSGPKSSSAWPQPYSVQRDDAVGMLTLRTPYYVFEHDLRKGGEISRIALQHGKATNLLATPLAIQVRDDKGNVLTDLKDSSPKIMQRQEGRSQVVTVECALADAQGRRSDLRVKSTFDYRWGYVKIRREFLVPASGIRVQELCPCSTVLAPNLSDYGYREGTTEEEGAPPFAFGSNLWGKLRRDQGSEAAVQTRYVPRSMIFVDPGVEGLEWFRGSDLAQWDMSLTGRRGQGQCYLKSSQDPAGWALSLSPLMSTKEVITLSNTCAFDFYLAVPLRESQASQPWLHTSFNRNHGNWVSLEDIRRWAEQGYQSVHCHNDGDYYDDGLFWRDGAYPPYPDMDRYNMVLEECRRQGIRTATYFSNKELHPSTRAFQEQGTNWSRQNRKGELQHNFFRGQSEFGAQMCLRSGWLDFLKSSIDRVLKNHPLDGVYYDWNVALLCCNPLHEGRNNTNASALGHWDIDELLDLMEWTRNRVGPNGLVIVHNTTTPMFATENFADAVVATEWGYQKWTDRAPELADLPVEWSLAGARARGVISYGTIDSQAPRRLHRLFALEAFLGGVSPWPASPETFELMSLLKPLGDFSSLRFADWRNPVVELSDRRCASAIYSRSGEAFILLANLDASRKEVTCKLRPERLPVPLARPTVATQWTLGATSANSSENGAASNLDVRQLVGAGLKIDVPSDGAMLIQLH
jgi:hypothetical protein